MKLKKYIMNTKFIVAREDQQTETFDLATFKKLGNATFKDDKDLDFALDRLGFNGFDVLSPEEFAWEMNDTISFMDFCVAVKIRPSHDELLELLKSFDYSTAQLWGYIDVEKVAEELEIDLDVLGDELVFDILGRSISHVDTIVCVNDLLAANLEDYSTKQP